MLKKFSNPIFLNLIAIHLVFIFIFALERILIIFSNPSLYSDIPNYILFLSFINGFRFDTAVTFYSLSIWYLVNFTLFFINRIKLAYKFNLSYLTFIAFTYFFLALSEVNYYSYFKVRLNSYFVLWEGSPLFVLNMIWSMYPVIKILVFLTLCTYGFYKYFEFIQFRFLIVREYKTKLSNKLILFLFLTPLFFLGIRGSYSKLRPLVWGHSAFSSYHEANDLALNGIFTLVNDIIYFKNDAKDLDKMTGISDKEKAYQVTQNLIKDSSSKFIRFPFRQYDFPDSITKKYNVVVILMESMGEANIEECENKISRKLFISDLKEKSIYFKNHYGNGFHTYMGLFSSMFGLPSTYGENQMQRRETQQKFIGLPSVLRENGYKTIFGVPHDATFDNMGPFMHENGVDEVVDRFNFRLDQVISPMGVPDHLLFEKMNDRMKDLQEPFLSVMLSSSNHGPWVIPKVDGKKFNNTLEYSDWALEHYFSLAQKEKYFENTIFVISGDHGIGINPIYELDLSSTHIPLLFYNPKLIKPKKIDNITSHIDLPNSILSFLKIDFTTSNFGRNIFDFENNGNGIALMQEGKNLGLVYNDWYLLDNLKGDPYLYKYRSNNPRADLSKKFPDTLKLLQEYARSYYFAGNDLIFNKKLAKSNLVKILKQ
ncbi:MAG: sulfatase-like hydrolase/transferase [Candidatus Kapabacteria bacterium]|nr:sulfatase-like hydrolase/transferase [Candidatus Kapabacteria bacterium]